MTELPDGYYLCSECKKVFVFDKSKNHTWRPRHFLDSLPYCKRCFNLLKDKKSKKQEAQIKEIGESLNIPVINCETAGTCEILKAHHCVLVDDPERLKTEFLIGIICGDEGVKKYKAKKDAQD